MAASEAVTKELAQLYRLHASRMAASLAAYFKLQSLELAEDVVQDTFEAALQHWQSAGIPEHPLAWLHQVCKNKALTIFARQHRAVAAASALPPLPTAPTADLFLEHEVANSQLRLLFSLCHTALSPKAQLLLILRHICSLKTAEIAAALGMQNEAVSKMLQRGRQTLQRQRQPLLVPSLAQSATYLPNVLLAVYLLYSEGYKASAGDKVLKEELCQEAIGILHQLLQVPPLATPAAHALMALLLLNTSRFGTRLGTNGELLELEEQDRAKWDRELIQLGYRHLAAAKAGKEITRYHIEAAIAATHCRAASFGQTNWEMILQLYDRLYRLQPSPFTALNRSVAVLYLHGPDVCLQNLRELPQVGWLQHHYLYHALLGKVYLFIGEKEKAAGHYKRASELATNTADKVYLQSKLTGIRPLPLCL